jgi:hypothetical protein
MKILRSLFSHCWLLVLVLGLTQLASADDTYSWYLNPRFGTVVLYPANLLTKAQESDNGDGTRFASADGRITFTVFASYNVTNRTLRGDLAASRSYWTRKGATITAWKIKKDWFITSGFVGQDIFYEKTILSNGIFHTMTWLYPASLRRRLDTAVTRSVASFQSANFHKAAGTAPSSTPAPKPAPKPKPVPSVVPPPVAATPRSLPTATPRPVKPEPGY